MKARFKRFALVKIVSCEMFPELCGEVTMVLEPRSSIAFLEPAEYLTSLVRHNFQLIFNDFQLVPVEYDGKTKSSWGARFEDRLKDEDLWRPAQSYIVGDTLTIVRNGVITRAQIAQRG
jgi:hypothetical protein